MQTITGKSNQYLKLARALQTRKGRQASGCFAVEGCRLAEEAASRAHCEFALFATDALAAPRMQALAERLAASGVSCFALADHLLAQACETQHPQGVLVAVHLPQLLRPTDGNGWYAYCDDIADPGNLGTIWRSAHAAGASGLLLSAASADPFNPKAVRASMGACFKLPVYRCASTEDAAALFSQLGLLPLSAAADGRDVRLCGDWLAEPHVWLLGGEANGVQPYWRSHAAAVSLPMQADAESLNVAAAAAVLFYQSRFRQEKDGALRG